MRLSFRTLTSLGMILPAAALPALASAQNYADLPPLTGMSPTEVRSLPVEYRTAPMAAQSAQMAQTTTIGADGVETITRTRRIDAPRPVMPAAPAPMPQPGYAPQYYPAQGYPMAYTPAPVVFERQQWLDECRRRTRGRNNDDTGLIIGGLLGAIAGGVAGYEIAGVGDRVLGAVLGAGGGGLIGGLLGSLIGGGKKKNRYDCEAALDGYLTQYGAPGTRIASREIAYAPSYGYGYPASYSYAYAPAPQMVMVQVQSEQQQQVVVRETVREETYTVPGTSRIIPAPAPRPSPKMIKTR
jgi:hypothetical protein